MKKTWLGLLMPVLFCACSEQNTGGEYFLRGQEVKFASANENLWPEFMYGNAVLATADNGSSYIGRITKNEWKKAEGLPKNDGHEDLAFPRFSKGYKGELMLLNQPMSGDMNSSNLISLIKIPHANNIASINNLSKWERYDLRKILGFVPISRSYLAISDTTILLAGWVASDIKHVFSIIDFTNQKLIPLDYWPEDDTPNDTIRWEHNVANCTIYGNGKGKFLYQNPFAKLAYIFSIDGTKVNKLCDVYSYKFTKTRPTECLSGCANSDRIYMLIRDSNIKGEKCKEDDRFMFGNTVEVFDWDGVKQEVIHLDNYYKEIMLSGDGNTLYLLPGSTDEIIKPAIYSYDISNLANHPMIDSTEIQKICKSNAEKNLEKYGKNNNVSLKEGDRMADFELYDYNDKPHHLTEFLGKGKYTILEVSGIGCGPCQAAKPYLEKFYKQYKDKFEMITISTDRVLEWKKKPVGEVSWHEWNDHIMARDIIKKYDIKGIPTFIIIDPKGKILSKSLNLKNFSEALKKHIPAEEVDKVMGFK